MKLHKRLYVSITGKQVLETILQLKDLPENMNRLVYTETKSRTMIARLWIYAEVLYFIIVLLSPQ